MADKSVQLSNNMDVHYLVQQEVHDIREAIDIRHCLNVDHSFLPTLSGSSGKLVPLVDSVAKVDLSDEDNVYILEDLTRFTAGTPMTARDFDTIMSRLQWSYLKSLVTVPFQEAVYMFFSKWASQSAEVMSKRIQEAERTMLHLLAEQDTSVGLLYGIFDTLDDTENIDLQNSTVYFDTKTGIALPQQLQTQEIKDVHVTQILEATNIILADYIDTNIVAPRHNVEKSRPFLISRKVYTNDPQEKVLLDVIVRPEDVDFKKASSYLLKLPAKNGIEKIRVTSKTKGANAYLTTETDVKSELVFGTIENPIDNIEELKFSLISTVPDGNDSTGAYHLFLVHALQLFDVPLSAKTASLITKEMEFPKRNGDPYKFRTVFVEVNGGQGSADVIDSNKLRIRAEVYYPETNQWSPKIPIKNSSHKLVVPSVKFSNVSDRNQQLVVPFELGPSQYFAQVDFAIQDATVMDMQFTPEVFDSILDPDELIVLRGAGSKTPYVHPTNPLFSDPDDAGWLFVNNYYQTNVFVPEGDQIEIDFGKNSVLINGVTVTGKYLFTSGVHAVSVSRSNWHHVSPGLTSAQVVSQDPLFPYNHKYLIQGYPDVKEYQGVTTFGRQVCTFVDPDYLMLNLYGEDPDRFKKLSGTKHPSIYSIYSYQIGGGSPEDRTLILLPIDSTYTDFNKEKVVIWGHKYSSSELASRLKLTFELESAVTSLGASEAPIYISSYTARVI
jgi:hypothetical protein